MKSIEILYQIANTIQHNASSIYQIPWDELLLCLTTELDCRKELYPDTQFQSLKQLFQHRFQQINNYLLTSDSIAIVNILNEFIFALQLLPNAEYTDIMTSQAHYNQARLNHYLNDTIIVLGDSHVNFFSGNETLCFSPIGNDINVCPTINNAPFTALHLGPCLAYNCNKANSSTYFREKVDFLCNNFIKPNAHIICCLGEIDLRVHVLRQTIAQNRTYQEIIDDILKEYILFLVSLKEKGYSVYCWGPIASQSELCPLDPAFPRTGSEVERNKATAYFTQQLDLQCKQHQIPFLSIFNQMVTDDYHTIETYLSTDHCHLSQSALELAQPIWEKILPI